MTRNYHMSVPDELDDVVNGLAWAMGCSRDEVWRKAIALLEAAVKAKLQGQGVWICEKDGALARRIVGLIPGDTNENGPSAEDTRAAPQEVTEDE